MFIDICHDSGRVCVKKEDVKYVELVGLVLMFHVHSLPFALKLQFTDPRDAANSYHFYKGKLGA